MLGLSIGMLMAVAQAAQGQLSDVSCISDQISRAERTALGESARSAAPTLGPAGERLQQAAAACRQRLGWSPDRTGALAALSLTQILREESRSMLDQGGVPTERIDRWFEAQDLSTRTDPALIDQSSQRLVEALLAQGYPVERIEANGHLIGVYFGALVVIERVERGLPLD